MGKKLLKLLSSSLTLMILYKCSFLFDLLLQNNTKDKIEIIYSPALSSEQIQNKTPEKILLNKHDAYKITLDSLESIKIGAVMNKETPELECLDIDYLEIRHGLDTVILSDKQAILAALKKLDKHDWRILIK